MSLPPRRLAPEDSVYALKVPTPTPEPQAPTEETLLPLDDPSLAPPSQEELASQGEANGFYLSPAAEVWIRSHVQDLGYVIDWGTREIIDPNTGEVKGTVPTSFGN